VLWYKQQVDRLAALLRALDAIPPRLGRSLEDYRRQEQTLDAIQAVLNDIVSRRPPQPGVLFCSLHSAAAAAQAAVFVDAFQAAPPPLGSRQPPMLCRSGACRPSVAVALPPHCTALLTPNACVPPMFETQTHAAMHTPARDSHVHTQTPSMLPPLGPSPESPPLLFRTTGPSTWPPCAPTTTASCCTTTCRRCWRAAAGAGPAAAAALPSRTGSPRWWCGRNWW
jgi:hypothetical protein